MDRRTFLAALGIGVPLVAAPRRVYSFLWSNPVTRVVELALPGVDMTIVEVDGRSYVTRARWQKTPQGGVFALTREPLRAGARVSRIDIDPHLLPTG